MPEPTISLRDLRSAIETDLSITVPRATWSDWCRRVIVSGDASMDRRVGIPETTAIWTMAGLYRYQARNYTGEAYKRLYPTVQQKVKEFFNV